MACQIKYKSNGTVDRVFAVNGKDSKLYADLMNKLKIDSNAALDMYAHTYTSWFRKEYENIQGKYDENLEPVYQDAIKILHNRMDEINFSDYQDFTISRIADNFNVFDNGHFPINTDINMLESQLKSSGIKGVRIKRNINGYPYLTLDNTFYNPKTRHFYKIKNEPALRDWKLQQTMRSLANTLGVQIEWSNEMKENVIGQADVLNRVIQLAEGKADTAVLTEEVLHVIVSMMRGNGDYVAMMQAIEQLPEFQEVMDEYGDNPEYKYYEGPDKGKVSLTKLKEEAIVKRIKKEILGHEASEKQGPWYQAIINFLKKLISGRNAVDEIASFRKTAKSILGQDLNALNLNREIRRVDPNDYGNKVSEVFFDVEHRPAEQQRVLDYLDRMDNIAQRNKYKGKYVVEENGVKKVVDGRVSDIVDRVKKAVFNHYADQSEEMKEFYTTKGTINHLYAQLFMEEFLRIEKEGGDFSFSYDTMRDIVYESLKDHHDFKNVVDKYGKGYFDLGMDSESSVENFLAIGATVKSLYDSIRDIDPNAVIKTEQFVYDSTRPETLGGTIDVMVVWGDGKIGIYDYKNVARRKIKNVYQQIDDNKITGYDVQLAEYRNFFTNELGLDESSFRELRIIPLTVSYNMQTRQTTKILPSFNGMSKEQVKANIETGEHGFRGFTFRDYQAPIAAGGIYVEDDPNLNNFIQGLQNKLTELRGERKTAKRLEKLQVQRRIDRINKIIEDLIVYKSVDQPLNDIGDMLLLIRENHTTMSDEEVWDTMQMLKLYKDFNIAFEKTIDDMPEKVEIDGEMVPSNKNVLIRKVQEFNSKIDSAESTLMNEVIYRSSAYLEDTGTTDYEESLKKVREIPVERLKILQGGGMDQNILGAMWQGAGAMNNAVVQTIMTLLNESAEKQRLEYLGRELKIQKAHDNYTSWARQQGLNGMRVWDPIVDRERKRLISPYTKEFYNKRDEILQAGYEYLEATKGGIQGVPKKYLEWAEKHLDFNEEAWNRAVEEQKEQNKILNLSPQEIQYKTDALNRLNPKFNKLAWFERNNYYVKRPKSYKDPEMKQYIDPKFQRILDNPAALEYWEMYTQTMNEMAAASGLTNMDYTAVAHFRASTLEHMSTAFKDGSSIFGTSLRSALQVEENDELLGVIDIDGSGEVKNQIPIKGSSPLRSKLTQKEINELEDELEKEGYDRESSEFKQLMVNRQRAKEYEKGNKEKSLDLTVSLKLWTSSVLEYAHKKDVELKILMAKHVLNSKHYRTEMVDSKNGKVMNAFFRKAHKKLGSDTDLVEYVDKLVKLHLYNQRVQGKGAMTTKDGYSVAKMLQQGHRYLTYKALAVNPILAMASHFNGMMNARVMARMNQYYSKEGFKKALKQTFNSSEKAFTAIAFIEPAAKDVQNERANISSTSFGKKKLNDRNFLGFHRGLGNKMGLKSYKEKMKEQGFFNVDDPYWGDDAIANKIMIAMLHDWVLDSDGKIRMKNSRQVPLKNPNAKTLWELFDHTKVLEGDFGPDNLPIQGLSMAEFTRFRRILFEAQNFVKGSITMDSQSMYTTTMIGSAMMKFRTWMPGLMRARYQKLKWNPLLEEAQQGIHVGAMSSIVPPWKLIQLEKETMASLVAEVTKKVVLPTIGNFMQLLGSAVSMGLYKYKVNKNNLNLQYENYIKTRNIPREKFSKEAFMQMRKDQLNAMAYEVRMVVGWYILVNAILKGFGADDDEASIAAKTGYNMANRTLLEITFFFDPQSIFDIITNPAAIFGVLKDLYKWISNGIIESSRVVGLAPENKRDRTPMGYYTLKNIPMLNQVLSLMGYFPGYKTQVAPFTKVFQESEWYGLWEFFE